MSNDLSGATAGLQISTSQIEQFANQLPTRQTSGSQSISQSDAESTIKSTASEFESIFLSLMLKEMRSTLDQKDGGLFGGEGSDTFGGMFDMFMGQHLAESNPLGIGNAIESYMQNSVL
jgi:flagellar protein FlgJ